ncbi:hypothetical protein Pmani_014740 [Petrolisthes manimaculis]|uniref:Uncharacterized protein n=1 Tax=Petrolisthes manimaculis TaxID=1843537 RepID=A0AAE1PVV3_9EUCA|nr:hypothetical protein Pmani_014740 [Petrolisthes manimaculis]
MASLTPDTAHTSTLPLLNSNLNQPTSHSNHVSIVNTSTIPNLVSSQPTPPQTHPISTHPLSHIPPCPKHQPPATLNYLTLYPTSLNPVPNVNPHLNPKIPHPLYPRLQLCPKRQSPPQHPRPL